jgi:hypothetical protein
MKNQSNDWAEYARAQSDLKKLNKSDDFSWGIEHSLNVTLTDIQNRKSHDRSDVERRIQTGSRRNRNRSRIVRLQSLTWPTCNNDTENLTDAKFQLELMRTQVNDFDMVEMIAQGYSYSELAAHHSMGIPALRKRVSRAKNYAQRKFPRE